MLKKKHGSGFVERRLFACWWKPQAGGNPLQGLVGGRPISLVRIEYREVALASPHHLASRAHYYLFNCGPCQSYFRN